MGRPLYYSPAESGIPEHVRENVPDALSPEEGRWRVTGWIARDEEKIGSMGQMCRAFDEKLGKEVAIKFVPLWKYSAGEVGNVHREAKIVASLEHPNIAKVYDYVEQDGWGIFVQELVDGESLDDFMASPEYKHDLTREQVCKWVLTVGAALDYAHENGVIHRDIKPKNIILSTYGPKLIDFGVASAPGVSHGYMAYSYAPVEMRDKGEAYPQSDVYSFALTAHALVYGDRVEKRLSEEYGVRPEISQSGEAALDAVFDKATREDYAERYASPGEFAKEFVRAINA